MTMTTPNAEIITLLRMHAFSLHNALPSPSFSSIFSNKTGNGVRKKRLSIVPRSGYNDSQNRPVSSGDAIPDAVYDDVINDGIAIDTEFRALHRAWSAGVDSNSAEDISRNSNDSLSLQASVKYASQQSVGIKDTEEEFLSAAEDE
jgi:hypothetical protein